MNQHFDGYSQHFKRMGNNPPDYASVIKSPERHSIKAAWLPKDLSSPILDIGCGWGHLLLSLWASGFRNLTGVEVSKDQYEIAKASLPKEIHIVYADANEFLKQRSEEYSLITAFDLIEHMSSQSGLALLKEARNALKPSGSIVLRTPNMANIVATYSRYLDITHVEGYSEWSLFQLLDMAGFSDHRVVGPAINMKYWKWYAPWRGFDLRERLTSALQKLIYKSLHLYPLPSSCNFNL